MDIDIVYHGSVLYVVLLTVNFLWNSKVLTDDTSDSSNIELHEPCRITMNITKNGLHRDLTTTVIMSSDGFANSVQHVEIILNQELPPGLYVDLFETKSMEEFGGVKVYSRDTIDIEKPEDISPSHTILVYTKLARSGQHFHTQVTFPVHIRYHKPSNGGGFAQVSLAEPRIFTKASDPEMDFPELLEEFPCHPEESTSKNICLWQKTPCQLGTVEPGVQLTMPIGDRAHTFVVVTVTLLVTIAATMFLVHSVLSKDITNCDTRPEGKSS